MAGLPPAIHVFVAGKKVVDARHKAGHDQKLCGRLRPASPVANRFDAKPR
jgi:hypothetical protein